MKKKVLIIVLFTLFILIISLFIFSVGQSEELWNDLYIEPTRFQMMHMDYAKALNDLSYFDKISYKTMLRSSSSYQKSYLQFSGMVSAFLDAGNSNAIFVIAVDDISDQRLVCLAPEFKNREWGEQKIKLDRFLNGDKVTVYGMLLGIFDFGFNDWHDVPIFYVHSMSAQLD